MHPSLPGGLRLGHKHCELVQQERHMEGYPSPVPGCLYVKSGYNKKRLKKFPLAATVGFINLDKGA